MKPENFPESNVTFTRPENMTDEECGDLPLFNDGKTSVSLWRPDWKERLSILFFGKVWLGVISGRNHPPVWMWGTKNYFAEKANE